MINKIIPNIYGINVNIAANKNKCESNEFK